MEKIFALGFWVVVGVKGVHFYLRPLLMNPSRMGITANFFADVCTTLKARIARLKLDSNAPIF